MDDEEDACSSGGEWDGGDDDEIPDQMDVDDNEDDSELSDEISEDETEAKPKRSLVVNLRYGKGSGFPGAMKDEITVKPSSSNIHGKLQANGSTVPVPPANITTTTIPNGASQAPALPGPIQVTPQTYCAPIPKQLDSEKPYVTSAQASFKPQFPSTITGTATTSEPPTQTFQNPVMPPQTAAFSYH
jgi:hypothetical protein